MHDLKRAGLIESRRGAAGGYRLARDPSTIRLSDVVEAVEPALMASGVATDGESGAEVSRVWASVSESWRVSLDEVTLDRLCQRAGEGMFYI